MNHISGIRIVCLLCLLWVNCKKSNSGGTGGGHRGSDSQTVTYSYLDADVVQMPGAPGIISLATALGKTIMLAGVGNTTNTNSTNLVYIYDTAVGTWSSRALSAGHQGGAAISAGGKIIFAGGMSATNGTLASVDIFDVNTRQWTTDTTEAILIAGVSLGNMVLLCGQKGTSTGGPGIAEFYRVQ